MSWIIFAILSAISAALVAIFGKIGIKNIDTTLATTLRAFIMFLFLLFASLFLGKLNFSNAISKKDLVFIALSGLCGALSWFFYFFALKNGPASGVSAIDRLSVIFVIFFAFLFLGEGLSIKTMFGVFLLVSGAVLIVLK